MSVVTEMEKAWARQIVAVVGAQSAVEIINLAKLNGLFEPYQTRQQTIDECVAAMVTIPQKEFATASDGYLSGFQAGALAMSDAIRALTSTPREE